MRERCFYFIGIGSFLGFGRKIKGKRKTFKRLDISVFIFYVNGWILRGEGVLVKNFIVLWVMLKREGFMFCFLFRILGRKFIRYFYRYIIFRIF